MASPHMAGIAAGVLQRVKATDVFQNLSTYRQGELVDALLMSTAVPGPRRHAVQPQKSGRRPCQYGGGCGDSGLPHKHQWQARQG